MPSTPQVLSAEEKARLRAQMLHRLEQLRPEISTLLASQGEHPFGALADIPDPGDKAVADLLIDLENAQADRDVVEYRQIEQALGRIDGDGFGVCIACGQPIGFERLTASPTALRCLSCQNHHERTHANATPSL